MDESTQDRRFTDGLIVAAQSSRRRLFLKLLGGGVLGATTAAAGIGGIDRAEANPQFSPIWKSAKILVGNSPADQSPRQSITCPLFFESGEFSNAFHTLDLSKLPTTGKVKGTVTHYNNTIEPEFNSSIAVAVTRANDGVQYLIVSGEGKVTGGTGYFRNVDKAIVRGKYKVATSPNHQLIACVDCVVILVDT
ncbi:MAG: hypothetical protein IPK78_20535 [Rhodospirillales bacterium]|nr:hypothetical protein [Rhodospirillales bacterium]